MAIPAALPPVDGQHRNRALAAARHARAVELATAGMTDQQIADELGYSNRGTVYRLVHTALTRDLEEDVENHRRLESGRLDALQVSLWEKAMGGDTAAVHAVLQIIRARCRLLGVDLRTKPSAALAGSRGPLWSPKKNREGRPTCQCCAGYSQPSAWARSRRHRVDGHPSQDDESCRTVVCTCPPGTVMPSPWLG